MFRLVGCDDVGAVVAEIQETSTIRFAEKPNELDDRYLIMAVERDGSQSIIDRFVPSHVAVAQVDTFNRIHAGTGRSAMMLSVSALIPELARFLPVLKPAG